MNTDEFLASLHHLGVRVWLQDDEVRVKAPKGVLDEGLRRDLKARKDELRQWLEQREGAPLCPPLVAELRPARIALSYAQQRLWFIDQLQEGKSPEYNMPSALHLRGELNLPALNRTIRTLIAGTRVCAPTSRWWTASPTR